MDTLAIDLRDLRRPTWTPEEAANAELVMDFVRLLMNEHEFDAVRERFGSGSYVQHNHSIADGIEGVIATVSGFVRRFPDYAYDMKSVLVDDDMVVLHSHVTLRDSHRGNPRKGVNIMDRWRVEDGRLVEHWDAVQALDLFGRLHTLLAGGTVRNEHGSF